MNKPSIPLERIILHFSGKERWTLHTYATCCMSQNLLQQKSSVKFQVTFCDMNYGDMHLITIKI